MGESMPCWEETWEPNTSHQHMEALDRAGSLGEVDLHPKQPSVDFVILMEVGLGRVAKGPLDQAKSSLSGVIFLESPRISVPVEEVSAENPIL